MSADDTKSRTDGRHEPQQIAVKDAERTVTITWGDGHISRFPNWYLRGFCPCAVCQGHGNAITFQAERAEGVGPDLKTIDEVGHYAINLTWSDGHKTGIYTLDALRNMCPCPACQHSQLGRIMMDRLPEDRRQALRQST